MLRIFPQERKDCQSYLAELKKPAARSSGESRPRPPVFPWSPTLRATPAPVPSHKVGALRSLARFGGIALVVLFGGAAGIGHPRGPITGGPPSPEISHISSAHIFIYIWRYI